MVLAHCVVFLRSDGTIFLFRLLKVINENIHGKLGYLSLSTIDSFKAENGSQSPCLQKASPFH